MYSERTSISKIAVFCAVIITGITACRNDNPNSSEPDPEFDFSGDLIAFRSDRDGSNDILLMKPDGSQVINITNNPANDSDPAWSPDGSKIAFVSTRSGNADLYVMNVDGSDVIQVTDNHGSVRFPSWSPDGSMIAFSSNVDDQRDIYVVAAPGSSKELANGLLLANDPLQLTDNPAVDNEPVFSADGLDIFFFSNREGEGAIWSLKFDGTIDDKPVKLTGEFIFACSPGSGFTLVDSKVKVSFVGKDNDQYDVWVMDFDGSNKVNVTNHPSVDWSSSWTGDGDQLIFDTDRDEDWNIYSTDTDGTNTEQLTDHPADDEQPRWRP